MPTQLAARLLVVCVHSRASVTWDVVSGAGRFDLGGVIDDHDGVSRPEQPLVSCEELSALLAALLGRVDAVEAGKRTVGGRQR
jgi:hypothetical protein